MPTWFLWAYASATITEFNYVHWSRWYSDIFTGCTCFAVLPLIYTGASLDWRLGRGSICNSPMRKKGEVFWHFSSILCFCVCHERVLEQKFPHPLALANLTSGPTGPNSSLSSRISLTVAFPWPSLTPFFCWLLWDLAFPRLLPVL